MDWGEGGFLKAGFLPLPAPLDFPRRLSFGEGQGRTIRVLPPVGCQSPVVQSWMAGYRVPGDSLSLSAPQFFSDEEVWTTEFPNR